MITPEQKQEAFAVVEEIAACIVKSLEEEK